MVRRPYVCNAGCSHGPASVANDVIMTIAGLVAACTGQIYSDWRQACGRARATLYFSRKVYIFTALVLAHLWLLGDLALFKCP